MAGSTKRSSVVLFAPAYAVARSLLEVLIVSREPDAELQSRCGEEVGQRLGHDEWVAVVLRSFMCEALQGQAPRKW